MSAFMRHLLCYGQQRRSFLVCEAGAQSVCAITLFKYPWLLHPSSLTLSSSHGACSSTEIRCSSSLVWRRPSSSISGSGGFRVQGFGCLSWKERELTWMKYFPVDAGEAYMIDQVWEEYCADRSQWWDNRVGKRNPKSPDFKHKVTRKALWIDGWSTPPWVKAMLNAETQGKLQRHVGYQSSDCQATAQSNRLPKGNVQIGQGGSGNMRNVRTTSEALVVLKNCLKQGIFVDSYMYVEVLKRCLKQKDLIAAKQVHNCIVQSKMDQNLYVANNLLMVYIRCGRLMDARIVFDELVKKDVISWNVMIGGYAQHNHGKDAMELFKEMRQEGAQPDEVSYVSILKACGSPSTLKWGKEVHECIRRGGLESGVRVGTALVQMYAKCGCIKEARKTFDKLTSRNVISWNVMIKAYADSGYGEEAYRLFLQMKQEGFKPDAITFLSSLNAPKGARALEWVKEVHSHVLEAGLELDLRVSSALVRIYARSGSIDDAQQVFDRMKEHDIITWTVLIGVYAESGCGEEAYRLFLQMKQEGFKPDAITFLSILNASASAGALQWVKDVHSHVLEAGLESDLRVSSALVQMYARSGSIDDAQQVFDRMKERDVIAWTVMIRAYAESGRIDDARLVFDRMKERDVITWTAMIGAYAESGCGEEAYRLLLQMKQEGFKPDAFTYTSILNACSSAGALKWVKQVHSHVLEAGLVSDLRLGNALVHMYAKSGSIDDARLVFDRMKERDVFSWTAMIGGLAQHGCGYEALEVFRKMTADDVKPDGLAFAAVLSACSHTGLVDEGRQLFSVMAQDYGIEPDVVHYSCMVDLLGRAGHLEEAKLFIGNMPLEPDEVTWGAFLGACRTYGNVELGELAAKELMKLKPMEASTYVLLSNIYAAAGKWEEVSLVRTMMQERGIRKEPGRSWIAVDNKIHEFVAGDTSHPEEKEIYAELRRLTEKIETQGYLPDTQLVLRNIDEKDKEFALCSHSEKLAIAYGHICLPTSKIIHVYKNLRVCSDCHTATKLISKVTRKEIVVRDANRFHHFKDGLCSCKDYW